MPKLSTACVPERLITFILFGVFGAIVAYLAIFISAAAVLIGFGFVGAVVGCGVLVKRIKDRLGRISLPLQPKPRQKNILIEFIRAKKNKICPILEFEE